jgi:hypothetical protein
MPCDGTSRYTSSSHCSAPTIPVLALAPTVTTSDGLPRGLVHDPFTFRVKGVAPGTYSLHLRPVVDGITWMEDEGVYMVVAVR